MKYNSRIHQIINNYDIERGFREYYLFDLFV